MFSLKPKEDIFFELFVKASQNAHHGALALNNLICNYTQHSKPMIDEIIDEIVKIESNGDMIKHEIEVKLKDSFITPYDREDIFLIAKKIDKFVNSLQAIALEFKVLHIDEMTSFAVEISNKLVNQTALMVELTENLKDKKKSHIVKDAITNMNKVESEVDKLYREGISKLFDNPQDLLLVIKWKEIYQLLEDASDNCEDAANSIDSVVTKNE